LSKADLDVLDSARLAFETPVPSLTLGETQRGDLHINNPDSSNRHYSAATSSESHRRLRPVLAVTPRSFIGWSSTSRVDSSRPLRSAAFLCIHEARRLFDAPLPSSDQTLSPGDTEDSLPFDFGSPVPGTHRHTREGE
jgi:hypothetical protein